MHASTVMAYAHGHGAFSAARNGARRRTLRLPDSPFRWSLGTKPSRGGNAMNRKLKGCVLALAAMVAPGMAIASNAQVLSAHELAQLTGVHERQVQMVFGARSQYAEY